MMPTAPRSAIFSNFSPTVAGKTGTAEVPPADPERLVRGVRAADHPGWSWSP